MSALAIAPAPAAEQQPANKFLDYVSRPAPKQPTRLILFATEGWGKTSFAAASPSPIFLMTKQETGLWTLINSGRLPNQVAHFPKPAETWTEVFQSLNLLLSQQHSFKTLVIDALTGIESLLHEEVCQRHFSGDWTDTGFMGYMRGYRLAVPELQRFLTKLDELRSKGMAIILLAHAQVATFKSPDSADYDRYSPALCKDSWAVLHRWADVILFGHRKPAQLNPGGSKRTKAKLSSNLDQPRVLMTERCAAWDAKNRNGLPTEIPCGHSAQEAWTNFASEMKGGNS